MRSWIVLCALLLCSATARARAAVVVEYFGAHPVDARYGKGICLIDGPHMHSYEPHDEVLYVHDGPYWTFVGDPTEYEPKPAVHAAYYGHHPVWWTAAPGEHYCYITGPHYHGHRPPPTVTFVERGGAYWYVGSHPVWYERHKHKHKVDAYYQRHAIVRPVVTVAPPVGWVGVQFGPVGIGLQLGAPVVYAPAPVVIEHHDVYHDHHGPPAWGHHKDHPGFPGKHGKHGKHGKGKHR